MNAALSPPSSAAQASAASVERQTRGERPLFQSRRTALQVTCVTCGGQSVTSTPNCDLCLSALAQLESVNVTITEARLGGMPEKVRPCSLVLRTCSITS